MAIRIINNYKLVSLCITRKEERKEVEEKEENLLFFFRRAKKQNGTCCPSFLRDPEIDSS